MPSSACGLTAIPTLSLHDALPIFDVADQHGDAGVAHQPGELLLDGGLELGRGLPRRVEVADERQGDLPVGPHRKRARQVGLLPDGDLDHVLARDAVLAYGLGILYLRRLTAVGAADRSVMERRSDAPERNPHREPSSAPGAACERKAA